MRPKSRINDFLDEAKEKYPVIKKLEDHSIFEFEDGGSDGIIVTECCDNWFSCSLAAEEVLQLAEFLKELAAVARFEQLKDKLKDSTPADGADGEAI